MTPVRDFFYSWLFICMQCVSEDVGCLLFPEAATKSSKQTLSQQASKTFILLITVRFTAAESWETETQTRARGGRIYKATKGKRGKITTTPSKENIYMFSMNCTFNYHRNVTQAQFLRLIYWGKVNANVKPWLRLSGRRQTPALKSFYDVYLILYK